MIVLVRRDAGWGDPAKESDAKKPHELIKSVRDLICLQYRNEERAILGKGP